MIAICKKASHGIFLNYILKKKPYLLVYVNMKVKFWEY